jgi:hypothetical protein
VLVYPGFDGSRYLGEEISARIRVSRGWEAGTKEAGDLGAYDFGMVFLASDDVTTKNRKELGGQPLGYWGSPTSGHKTVFAPLEATSLESKTVDTAGYPRGKKKTMWAGTGALSNVFIRIKDKIRTKRGMDHDAMESLGEDARGMSGGPVWLSRGAIRYLIGINSRITPVEHVNEKTRTKRKFWRAHSARTTIELFEEVIDWMHLKP